MADGRQQKLMAATMATATNSMPDAWAERMSLEVAHKAGADSISPTCLVAAAANHNQQHSDHIDFHGVCDKKLHIWRWCYTFYPLMWSPGVVIG